MQCGSVVDRGQVGALGVHVGACWCRMVTGVQHYIIQAFELDRDATTNTRLYISGDQYIFALRNARCRRMTKVLERSLQALLTFQFCRLCWPTKSVNFAREVRESWSALSAYSSEEVKEMIASLFNDKSPYALKLDNETVMREAVSSLFALINDYIYVPSSTKSKDSHHI